MDRLKDLFEADVVTFPALDPDEPDRELHVIDLKSFHPRFPDEQKEWPEEVPAVYHLHDSLVYPADPDAVADAVKAGVDLPEKCCKPGIRSRKGGGAAETRLAPWCWMCPQCVSAVGKKQKPAYSLAIGLDYGRAPPADTRRPRPVQSAASAPPSPPPSPRSPPPTPPAGTTEAAEEGSPSQPPSPPQPPAPPPPPSEPPAARRSRSHLPADPSLVEEALLAPNRNYGIVVKVVSALKGGVAALRHALKGHCIVFGHDAPAVTRAATLGEAVEDLPTLLRCVFLTDVGQEDILAKRMMGTEPLAVRSRVIYAWLRVRAAIYKNRRALGLLPDDAEEGEEGREGEDAGPREPPEEELTEPRVAEIVGRAHDVLLKNALWLSDPLSRAVDARVATGHDIAHVRSGAGAGREEDSPEPGGGVGDEAAAAAAEGAGVASKRQRVAAPGLAGPVTPCEDDAPADGRAAAAAPDTEMELEQGQSTTAAQQQQQQQQQQQDVVMDDEDSHAESEQVGGGRAVAGEPVAAPAGLTPQPSTQPLTGAEGEVADEGDSDVLERLELSFRSVMPSEEKLSMNDVVSLAIGAISKVAGPEGGARPPAAERAARRSGARDGSEEGDELEPDEDEEEEEEEEVDEEGRVSPRAARPPIAARRNVVPFSEFHRNPEILHGVFFRQFLIGRGAESIGRTGPKPDGAGGSIPALKLRHLLRQYTGRFAKCKPLLFLLANQLQRHAAVRAASCLVKDDPASFAKFAEMVADEDFQALLDEAAEDPDGDARHTVIKRVMPVVNIVTGAVPYGSAARKRAITSIIAYARLFGCPGTFLTISPDDVHNPLSLRLCFKTVSNAEFPALDEGFLDALQGGQTVFETVIDGSAGRIGISEADLNGCAPTARGPLARALTLALCVCVCVCVCIPRSAAEAPLTRVHSSSHLRAGTRAQTRWRRQRCSSSPSTPSSRSSSGSRSSTALAPRR